MAQDRDHEEQFIERRRQANGQPADDRDPWWSALTKRWASSFHSDEERAWRPLTPKERADWEEDAPQLARAYLSAKLESLRRGRLDRGLCLHIERILGDEAPLYAEVRLVDEEVRRLHKLLRADTSLAAIAREL